MGPWESDLSETGGLSPSVLMFLPVLTPPTGSHTQLCREPRLEDWCSNAGTVGLRVRGLDPSVPIF